MPRDPADLPNPFSNTAPTLAALLEGHGTSQAPPAANASRADTQQLSLDGRIEPVRISLVPEQSALGPPASATPPPHMGGIGVHVGARTQRMDVVDLPPLRMAAASARSMSFPAPAFDAGDDDAPLALRGFASASLPVQARVANASRVPRLFLGLCVLSIFFVVVYTYFAHRENALRLQREATQSQAAATANTPALPSVAPLASARSGKAPMPESVQAGPRSQAPKR
jgi:hypothetical protein